MSPSDKAAAAAAHSLNKILNQPKSSKSKRSGDADESLKKLRRLILVEGIPSAVVRRSRICHNRLDSSSDSNRTRPSALGYGRFS